MTIEEIFSDLYDKYGEDFNWYMIPLTQADGVLYITDNGRNQDIYYIFHLTYSKHNPDGFPRYEELKDVYAVRKPVITWAQNKGNGSVYLDWVNIEDADSYA